MNRKNLTYLVITIVVVGALLVYILNMSGGNDQPKDGSNPEPAYQSNRWEPKLSLNSRDPYGLYVFEELMTSSGKFDQFNEYTDYALLDSIADLDSSLYMYIGMDFTLTNYEVDRLLEGVSKGNDLFLCTENIPRYLYSKLFNEYPLTFHTQKVAPISMNKKTYDMYYIYENDSLAEVWDLFSTSKITTQDEVLSTAFESPIYVKVKYGDGEVLLHLNPVTFTNFQLLRDQGKDYLKEVMTTFDQPKIQWLTFAKYEPVEYDIDTGESEGDNGLLAELFKFQSFRWAFIIAVFGVLLYFLFRSKRERPIIPALSKAKNTGFSFVDTLAGIYFEGNKAPKMLKVMRKNFYSAVYRHFYIDLSHRKNQKPIESLSKKSGVAEEQIEELIKLLETKVDISNNYLSKVNKLQREFYFQSGIWDDQVKAKVKNQDITVYRSKTQSAGIISAGILLIIFGFILLSSSVGMGILLWPVGIITLAIGARMFSLPIVKIHNDGITYLPLFNRANRIKFNEINHITQDGDLIKVHLYEKATIVINLNLVSPEYRESIKALKNKTNS